MDLGYQGMEKDFPSLKCKMPIKRKKGKVLEGKDKRYNRKLNRVRVVVEHVIGGMKKFKIMGSEFRNKLGRYDDMPIDRLRINQSQGDGVFGI